MYRIVLVHVLLLIFGFNISASENDRVSRMIIKYKENRNNYILKTNRDWNVDRINNLRFKNIKLNRTKAFAMDHNTEVLELDREITKNEAIAFSKEILSKKLEIEYIEPDFALQLAYQPNEFSSVNNSFLHLQNKSGYYLGIGAVNAWNFSFGQNTKIAILDTGYRRHPDLNNNYIYRSDGSVFGYDFVSSYNFSVNGDFSGIDNNAEDPIIYYSGTGFLYTDSRKVLNYIPGGKWFQYKEYTGDFHGTKVAGTAAAAGNNGIGAVGVAFQAKIVPVRVFGGGNAMTSDIANGIIWAAGGYPAGVPYDGHQPVDVINISLGGTNACGLTLQSAVDFALSRGVTVVVAAGNESQNASLTSPANCKGVIAVGASDVYGFKAMFSNYGDTVSIMAPGTQIWTSSFGLKNINTGQPLQYSSNGYAAVDPYIYSSNYIYESLSGTSFSAPIVSGIVALMKSANPSIFKYDTAAILRRLKETGESYCQQSSGGEGDGGYGGEGGSAYTVVCEETKRVSAANALDPKRVFLRVSEILYENNITIDTDITANIITAVSFGTPPFTYSTQIVSAEHASSTHPPQYTLLNANTSTPSIRTRLSPASYLGVANYPFMGRYYLKTTITDSTGFSSTVTSRQDIMAGSSGGDGGGDGGGGCDSCGGAY